MDDSMTNYTVDCDPVPRTKVSLQNEPHLTQPRTALLLIGSSRVSGFERIHDDVQLRSMSGAKTHDVLNMLQKHPNDDIGVVFIIVGSNDCSSKATPDDIIKRYECVLEEAKRVARDNVCVSSILPRLTSAAYNTKADILNDKLKALCSDMQCTFIDHDINLWFQGGSVDDSVFADNVHLNSKGLLRLINNLKLNDRIRAKLLLAMYPGLHKTRHLLQQGRRDLFTIMTNLRDAGFVARRVSESCHHGYRITCNKCHKQGHKQKCCRMLT